MARPKHSRKEVEKLLKAAEKSGCTVQKRGRASHFKVYSADGTKMRMVASSPSAEANDRLRKDLRALGANV